MTKHVHLLKLSVGTEGIDTLADWQQTMIHRNSAAGFGPIATHTTRMWPRREAEILAGGSIYWVIKGAILCRQRITGLQERRGEDGIRRCALVLDPQLVRTQSAVRRPFQGWRYLDPADAPRDIGAYAPGQESLPPELESELAFLGVL